MAAAAVIVVRASAAFAHGGDPTLIHACVIPPPNAVVIVYAPGSAGTRTSTAPRGATIPGMSLQAPIKPNRGRRRHRPIRPQGRERRQRPLLVCRAPQALLARPAVGPAGPHW